MAGPWVKLVPAAVAAAAVWAGGCSRSDPVASGAAADQGERVEAVRELGRQGSDAAVAQLEPLLAHEDPRTALEACGALGRSGRPRAARVLATALRGDVRPEVRTEAAVQLGYSREPEAADALRQAVQSDSEPLVRGAAAAALGKIGQLADVPLLVRVAETDKQPLVEAAAVKAVEKMTVMGFCYDPAAPEEERQAAIRRMRFWALRVAAILEERRKKEDRP